MNFEVCLFCWVVLLPAPIQQLDGGNGNEVAWRADQTSVSHGYGGRIYLPHTVKVANERFMLGLLTKNAMIVVK